MLSLTRLSPAVPSLLFIFFFKESKLKSGCYRGPTALSPVFFFSNIPNLRLLLRATTATSTIKSKHHLLNFADNLHRHPAVSPLQPPLFPFSDHHQFARSLPHVTTSTHITNSSTIHSFLHHRNLFSRRHLTSTFPFLNLPPTTTPPYNHHRSLASILHQTAILHQRHSFNIIPSPSSKSRPPAPSLSIVSFRSNLTSSSRRQPHLTLHLLRPPLLRQFNTHNHLLPLRADLPAIHSFHLPRRATVPPFTTQFTHHNPQPPFAPPQSGTEPCMGLTGLKPSPI